VIRLKLCGEMSLSLSGVACDDDDEPARCQRKSCKQASEETAVKIKALEAEVHVLRIREHNIKRGCDENHETDMAEAIRRFDILEEDMKQTRRLRNRDAAALRCSKEMIALLIVQRDDARKERAEYRMQATSTDRQLRRAETASRHRLSDAASELHSSTAANDAAAAAASTAAGAHAKQLANQEKLAVKLADEAEKAAAQAAKALARAEKAASELGVALLAKNKASRRRRHTSSSSWRGPKTRRLGSQKSWPASTLRRVIVRTMRPTTYSPRSQSGWCVRERSSTSAGFLRRAHSSPPTLQPHSR
jgi:hypothetical protein